MGGGGIDSDKQLTRDQRLKRGHPGGVFKRLSEFFPLVSSKVQDAWTLFWLKPNLDYKWLAYVQ